MDATLSFSSSGGDVRTLVPRTQLNGAPPPPPGLEVQSPVSSLHSTLVKNSARATPFATCSCLYLVRCFIHIRFYAFLAATGWYHLSGNTFSSFFTYSQKQCWYRPCGNPLCHWCRPTCWTWPFPEAWSVLDRPKQLDSATFTMRTVTLCTINFVSPFCNGIQAQRAGIPHRS